MAELLQRKLNNVRYHFHFKGCTSIVVYKEETIKDMVSLAAADKNHIVFIDATFSTSYYKVTTISYLNNKVTRALSGKPPIFAGVVLMHAIGDAQVHEQFLAHVKEKIEDEARTQKIEDISSKMISCTYEYGAEVKALETLYADNVKFLTIIRHKQK